MEPPSFLPTQPINRKDVQRVSGNHSTHLLRLKLDQVPEEIAALSELRVLALDNNEIKTVPKSIGKLSHLQSLLLRCVQPSLVLEINSLMS